jgi:hypothetical protein
MRAPLGDQEREVLETAALLCDVGLIASHAATTSTAIT